MHELEYACSWMDFRLTAIIFQVAKREKLEKIRDEEAVQIAMESELNKTIRITGTKVI